MESRAQAQIIGLLTGLLILSAGCRKSSRQITPYTFTESEKALFEEGDIILRKGEGVLSELITDYLGDTLNVSHCGILIKNQDGWQVIHSLSQSLSDQDGVQICPLDQFTAESIPRSLKVVRYTKDTLHLLASQAIYYLHIRKPFDNRFDMQDTSAFFCSQLPLHILKYTLHSDLPIGKGLPSFSLFLDKAYFQTIYSVVSLPVRDRKNSGFLDRGLFVPASLRKAERHACESGR